MIEEIVKRINQLKWSLETTRVRTKQLAEVLTQVSSSMSDWSKMVSDMIQDGLILEEEE